MGSAFEIMQWGSQRDASFQEKEGKKWEIENGRIGLLFLSVFDLLLSQLSQGSLLIFFSEVPI